MQWQERWCSGIPRFRDQEGQMWRPNPAYGMGVLRSMIGEVKIGQMWLTASQHRHSEGMEHGLDLS
eukprot:5033069-Karenia_brevis.AAC.1